ncbi:MAG: hypothetical protein HUJ94_04810 [Bacteroidales bacterium]|nr:hypothetical protein [Bacteroidales bacterium]
MDIVKKIFTWFILPAVIVLLVWLSYASVMRPVKFEKERSIRERVAVQRLKDIRDLQVAFKGNTGRFASTLDSIVDFYNNGKIVITQQVGSADDSASVAFTTNFMKTHKKITPKEMLSIYNKAKANGTAETLLVFKVDSTVNVKDELFVGRADFHADSLLYIPFSGGKLTKMESVTKTVSGVIVPLFEAKMPFKQILKGLDEQLIINLIDDRVNTDRYPGLQVGSVTTPNNNAGNWE